MRREGTFWWGREGTANHSYSGPPIAAAEPDSAEAYYHHVSRMKDGPGWKWVGASGVTGLRSALVPLPGMDTSKELVVKLYFAEPEHEQAGARVFSVSLEGRELLKDFDIFKEAGAANRTVVKEFRGIRCGPRKHEGAPALELAFAPHVGAALVCGVEVIEAERLAQLHRGDAKARSTALGDAAGIRPGP
jgi:hypothetical protein